MLYVATKSDTFTPEEIHKALHMVQHSLSEKFTLYSVAIAFLYYGLLGCSEVRMIKVKGVQEISEQGSTFVEVNFMYQHKQWNAGFTCHNPSSFVPLFRKFMRQICPKSVEYGQLQFQKKIECLWQAQHPEYR